MMPGIYLAHIWHICRKVYVYHMPWYVPIYNCMPGICAMYMPGMHWIDLAYVLHMPGTCLAYAYNAMSIQHDPAWETWSGWSQQTHKGWTWHMSDIFHSVICHGYALHIYGIYSDANHIPDIWLGYDRRLLFIYFVHMEPSTMAYAVHMRVHGICSCASDHARLMPDIWLTPDRHLRFIFFLFTWNLYLCNMPCHISYKDMACR